MKLHLLDLRRRDSLLVWVLFALALVVRFRYLLWIEHNVDHAYYIGQALRTLDEGYLPIIGQATSLQFPNSAFLGYLYVPLLALTRHMLSAYVFVIALNSLGVVFVHRAARMLGLSSFAAFTAGLLYAFNPWLIEYTRSTWSYSIMPFLLTCLFYSVLVILTVKGRRQTKAVWVSAVCATMITLVTLTGYLILPTLAVIALVYHKRLPWRNILVALPIFVIPTAAFAGALLTNWQDTSARASTFLGASQAAYLRSEPLLHTLRLVSGAEYELQRGLKVGEDSLAVRNLLGGVFSAITAILIIIGVSTLHKKKNIALLIIWAVAPNFLFIYNSALVHPFYLLLTVPAAVLLTAAGIHWVTQNKQPIITFSAITAITGWSLLSLTNSSLYYQETQQHPSEHDLTALPLYDGLPLGAALSELPDNILIQASIEPWILHSFAGKTFPTTSSIDNVQRAAAPPNGTYVITMQERPTQTILPESLYWQRSLTDQGSIKIAALLPNIPPNARLLVGKTEGDIALTAYTLDHTDTETQFTAYWRVNRMPIDITPLYSLTVHVYQSGERIAVIDGKPVPTYLWAKGTLTAQRVTLPITTNQINGVVLRVGLYDGMKGQHAVISSQEPDGLLTIELQPEDQNG
ncbi:MAG: hypothetical protein SNJ54_00575 [Anaerolineae bacterium]